MSEAALVPVPGPSGTDGQALLEQYRQALPQAQQAICGAAAASTMFGRFFVILALVFWLLSLFVWTTTPLALVAQLLATAVLAALGGVLFWARRRGKAPIEARCRQFGYFGLRERIASGWILPGNARITAAYPRELKPAKLASSFDIDSRASDLCSFAMSAKFYLNTDPVRPVVRWLNAGRDWAWILALLVALAIWTKIYSLPLLPLLLILPFIVGSHLARWNMRALVQYLGVENSDTNPDWP